MAIGFKVILSSESLYKDIILKPDMMSIKFGTEADCEVRLRKELFESTFAISVKRNGDAWDVSASDGIYFVDCENRKMRAVKAVHGTELKVYYLNTGAELFAIDFVLDFESEHKAYQCEIDIEGHQKIAIGNRNTNDIVMQSEYARGDNVVLERCAGGLRLKVLQTTYGIYKNGYPIKGEALIAPTDFFSIADCSFYYNHGKIYATNTDRLKIVGFSYKKSFESLTCLVYPQFNRSTHPEKQISNETIQVLDPPAKPAKTENSLLGNLVPSLASLALIIVVRGFMSTTSNISYILFSVGSMTIGIITSVVSYVKGKKKYKEEIKKRKHDYEKYISTKEQEIREARSAEVNMLNLAYPNEKQNLRLAEYFSGDLYDRSKGSSSFLKIRLGSGTKASVRPIEYSKKETIVPKEELENLPFQLSQKYRMVEGVPIFANLSVAHNLGIVGSDEHNFEFMKLMLLDICAHHYSKEVQLFFVVKQERLMDARWIRLLPHIQNDVTEERNIIYDDDSKASKLEYLYKEICKRRDEKEHLPDRWIIVFLLDEMDFFQHPVAKFLETAHQFRVHFISFVHYKELLPMYCGEIIQLKEAGRGELIEYADDSITEFEYGNVSDHDMRDFAQKMAPVYCQETALEGTLTKNISLFQMLGIYTVEDFDLSLKWGEKDITKTMEAPIGIKGKNEIVYLDLHEKAHGPHGLVAGTTGSGKSELLQTYILSMALHYPPYEVSFVLIDFKGGGMANQFKNLPHLVGSITDIDGAEIARSLLSIKAELDKRKSLFAEADVNNIENYIKKFRKGEVDTPLPHLIIIVDEFAELKADQPEFMKELISASRTGRSLGVHLILATQKPSGQVSEQIWSNSKFKLCLKVQSQSDSNEVLHSPLAAEIREAGRAYMQVGNNEIFELFQSAYSGAPEQDFSDEIKRKKFQIAQVDFAGRKTVVFEQRDKEAEHYSRTQLNAVVDYIERYCREIHLQPLQAICLPPLPDSINFPQHIIPSSDKELIVGFGFYDAPASQYQGLANIQLSGKNTAVIGSSQYGKTNLLQVLIRMLATSYTPQEVNIYILDFASLFLKNYEMLPHVGGVVSASEEEGITNLFKLLNEELIKRRDCLVKAGVSSFSAYKEAGYTDLPYIVLMIDNFTAFKESYLEREDFLLPICREGNAVGISVVITNMQTSGFGYRYFSTISNHIAFYCNEKEEYHNIFGYTKERIHPVPGRCLFEIDKTIFQAQVFLAFEGEKEIERSREIHRFIDAKQKQYPNEKARQIPRVPEVLYVKDAYSWNHELSCSQCFNIGVKYDGIEDLIIDLRKSFLLSIIGGREEAKRAFICAFLRDIEQNFFHRKCQLYFVDGISRPYRKYENMPYVQKYSSQPDALLEMISLIIEELEARMRLIEEMGEGILEEQPLLLVLCNNRQAVELLGNSRSDMKVFDNIAQNYRNLKVLFIFSNVENTGSLISAGDLMKRIRDERNALIFDPLKNVKLFDLSLKTIKEKDYPLGQDDAFYLNKDDVDRVKLYKE